MIEAFKSGFNCAQAIFSTYAPELGIDKNSALRISCGFGGGIGRLQEVCGALTAATMIVGLKYGRDNLEDPIGAETTYSTTRDLARRFEAEHGSIKCLDLLGCNLNTEDGMKFFKEHNLSKVRCVKYIEEASHLLENVIYRAK